MLSIQVLGGLTLTDDGAPLDPPPPGRARALLAWLAVHPGRHPRGELAGRLRPDAPQESARKSLRQAAWALRGSLGTAADAYLDAGRGHLGLDPDNVRVDVVEQSRLIGEGELEAAVELGIGELLPGFDDEWVYSAREHHRSRVCDALAGLADRAEEKGDIEGAVVWSQQLVEVEPLGETGQRELVRRLALAGDRASAIASYDTFAARLRRELSIVPSKPTRRLVDEIRRGTGPEAAPVVPAGETPVPLPGVLLRSDRFVGRREPLAQMERALGDAAGGALRAVVVRGDAGMGKTRLLAEAGAAAHAQGWVVMYGRSDEDAVVAFQPFVECLTRYAESLSPGEVGRIAGPYQADLARLLPHLGVAPAANVDDAATERYRAFEAVRGVIEATAVDRPVLLILDDLHWADDATLQLVRHLARMTRRGSLCLTLAYRHTEVGRGHPLTAVLGELRREHPISEITLEGLDDRDVAELLRARGADSIVTRAKAVRERTLGNPFFVSELALHVREDRRAGGRSAVAALPQGVKHVVERRVSRLGPQVASLLTAGAVLGSEFDLGVVADLGLDGLSFDEVFDAATVAEDAGLLVGVPDAPSRVAFAHALVAETQLDNLTAAAAVRLHEKIAAALIGRDSKNAPVPPGEVARHLAAAGARSDPAALAEWSLRAGRDAVARLAYEEAVTHFRRALAGLADPSERARTLSAIGDAHSRAGRGEDARRSFCEAAELAREAGEEGILAEAALGHGGLGVVIAATDPTREAMIEEALERLPASAHALRAQLKARLAVEVYYSSLARADALSREAVDEAERAHDPATLASALNARRVAIWSGDAAVERLEVATRMLATARSAADDALVLQAHNWRVVDLMELGRFPEVEAEIADYERLADRVALPHYLWYVPLWRATLAGLHGDFDAMPALQRRALALGRRAGDSNAEPFEFIQRTSALQEQFRHADIDTRRMDEIAAGSAAESFAYDSWHAGIAAVLGRVDEARARLDALAVDDFARMPRDANWHVICEVAETAVTLGDRERCDRLYELMLPHRALWPVVARGIHVYGYAEDWLARLAVVAGRADAEEHFARAVAGYQRAHVPARLAVTQARFGASIAGSSPAGADELLDSAAELAGPFPGVADEVARLGAGAR